VLIYPWIGDELCHSCNDWNEHLCESPKTLGIYQDGGYADLILVSNYKYLIKLN
jgi:alcohol dehydrogenase, propanol-preferring